jgi:diguanylate cyclase (GGDEF)-like protein
MSETLEAAKEPKGNGTATPAAGMKMAAQKAAGPAPEQRSVSAPDDGASRVQSTQVAEDETRASTLAHAQAVAEKLSTATEQVACALSEAATTIEELGKSIETISAGADEAAAAAEESCAAIKQFEKASDAADTQAHEMEQLAFLDPVTRLPNRRYVETSLTTALDQFHKHKEPFGVLLIDLDQFKTINDEFGHINGDRALREVGKILSGELRSMDIVGRWGGDEFIAVFHHVDGKILRELAERCCVMVARTAIPNGARTPVSLSVSIGGTLALLEDTADELIERADKLMYQCKTSGRGRALIDYSSPVASD